MLYFTSDLEVLIQNPYNIASSGLTPSAWVQADRIITNADGSMSATSLKQVTTYGADGSITVTDRATGQVMFHKKGGG